jgi:hypothetical protein
MTLKITPKAFVFCLHHGIQFLTSNQISLYLGKSHKKMCTQHLLICKKNKNKISAPYMNVKNQKMQIDY